MVTMIMAVIVFALTVYALCLPWFTIAPKDLQFMDSKTNYVPNVNVLF